MKDVAIILPVQCILGDDVHSLLALELMLKQQGKGRPLPEPVPSMASEEAHK